MSDLETLEQSLLSDIASASDEQAIEAVRVSALGKKGSVSELLKTLGAMSADERQAKGPVINGLKNRVTDALSARKTELRDVAITARLIAEKVDVTLPVRQSPAERGRIHPISQVIDEIAAIFGDLGFAIAEGPDVETDHYNFTALNFPEGHPAREMHDTFFFPPDGNGERKLLRTHTSPVQIRTMETQKPPIRIVIPGKTYRQDSDATHSPMFHQVEGLVIDKSANIANVRQDALPPVLLPVHRAEPRGRHPVRPFAARRSALRRRQRLDGDPRLRHGSPQRAAPWRSRSRRVPGLRLGHGHRPHCHAEIRHA
jgi:phenylalanyl-tRNA synthetase alpha chain